MHGGRLYLAERTGAGSSDDDGESWRVEGNQTVREDRFALRELPSPQQVNVYSHCSVCEPVLVRMDRSGLFGDIVNEHRLFVDFQLTFRTGEPMQAERISGTRDELKDELRARGVYVLNDDEPLAIAHHEIKKARERSDSRAPRRRR